MEHPLVIRHRYVATAVERAVLLRKLRDLEILKREAIEIR